MDTEAQVATVLDPLIEHAPANSVINVKVRQRALLHALAQCGTYRAAARMVGIDNHTVSRWIKKYPKFKELAAQAKEHAEQYVVADAIEENFYQRAIAGKSDQQSAVIGMFTLKKINNSYRDNAVVQVNASGPVAMQFNFATPLASTPQADQLDEK